jgi:hypothetical protein
LPSTEFVKKIGAVDLEQTADVRDVLLRREHNDLSNGLVEKVAERRLVQNAADERGDAEVQQPARAAARHAGHLLEPPQLQPSRLRPLRADLLRQLDFPSHQNAIIIETMMEKTDAHAPVQFVAGRFLELLDENKWQFLVFYLLNGGFDHGNLLLLLANHLQPVLHALCRFHLRLQPKNALLGLGNLDSFFVFLVVLVVYF